MKKNRFPILVTFFLLILPSFLGAQMSGVYTVPGSFNSIAGAINSINQFGVVGPVTINIASGYTETAVPGGYSIFTVVGASATNSILIKGSNSGTSPAVYSYTNGTNNSSSPSQDGMLSLIGADYITIEGLSFIDVNSTNPATMDYGIGLFRASSTDGCQYNTIRNCTISLSTVNDIAGNGLGGSGSKGIFSPCGLIASSNSSLAVYQASGGNSYNKFYGNSILNCHCGFWFLGPNALPSANLSVDAGNDIGGSSNTSGNTILNFGNSGSVSNSFGIYVNNQNNLNVSFNYLNSNNGNGNFHTASVSGIAAGYGNLTTIRHNSITVSTASVDASAIGITNGSNGTYYGDTVDISFNVIQNCNSNTLTSGYFRAISNFANCKKVYINNNAVLNNGFYYNYSTSQNFYYQLIRNYSEVSELISISGNTVTSWDKSPVSKSAAGLTAISVDAYSTNGPRIEINNNSFSNFIFDNTNTAALDYINVGTYASTLQVMGNTWNNLSLNNSGMQQLINIKQAHQTISANNQIVGSYVMTKNSGLACYVSDIYTGSGIYRCHEYVYGNNFSNVSCATSSVAFSFKGINIGNADNSYRHVYNNLISNITSTVQGSFDGINVGGLGESDIVQASAVHDNTITNISSGGWISGLSLVYNVDGMKPQIYSNKIQSLASISGTAVTGIGFYITGNGADFYKNKISDLSANGSSVQINGIAVAGCTNVNVYNNLIGKLAAPNNTVNYGLAGIKLNANAGDIKFDYNTVYLSSNTASNVSSAAITASSGVNLTLRNNILVNLCTPSGTGVAVAYKRSSTALSSYDAASNNNLFYAGVPASNHVIYHDGTSYTTLSSFKTLVANRDNNSVTENPAFVSTIGSATNFLNLSTSVATQAESGAVALSGINDDYAGVTRSVLPDIGAWEGSYISAGDSAAPVLLTGAFIGNACNNTQRTFTAQLSDMGGIASGSLAPRLYYSVNSASYVSVPGTLTSGSATLGIWTFNLSYTAVPGNIISYFIVAQDNSVPAHILSSSTTGFVATDVNTISQFPTSVQSFAVKMALSGVYNVGASQTFTSLSAAATAYNNSCLLGPVTFSLTDALYGALETFPITFQFHPDASQTNSLLIIPAAGTAAVIQPTLGAPGSDVLFKLYDARYIEINGLNYGGSSLSLFFATGASTLSTNASIWLAASTNTSGSGCQNINIRNLTLKGIGGQTNNMGILAATYSTSPFNVLYGLDNDSITVSGNTFLNFSHAIHAIGKRDTSLGGYDNWNILNNIFGPATTGTNAVATGVKIAYAGKIRIESNLFQNHIITYTGTPIHLESNVKNFSVKGNTITGVTYVGGSPANYIGAIDLGANVRKGTIEDNSIYSVKGQTGVRGIRVNTALANSELNVLNNFVSTCIGNYQYFASACMEVTSQSGGVKIIHNTFSQSGTVAATSSSTRFSALHISNAYNITRTGLEVVNNIFHNSFDNSSTSAEWIYALSSEVSASMFSVINYNNYYVSTSGGFGSLGMLAGSNVNSLTDVITNFGQNQNSTSNEPFFISPTDLHLSLSAPMNYFMENLGGPTTTTIDIDGQTRNLSTPDVGADEFTYTTSCSAANAGTITQTSISVCQNTPFSLQSFSLIPGIGINYQWKVSSSSSGTYSNVTGGQGGTTPVFQNSLSSTGTYYFMFTATCTTGSGTLTGSSNIITVSVTPGPNVTILSTPTVICSGNSTTLTATGATNYNWTSGPSTSSMAITPTASAVYNVTGYITGCNYQSSASRTIYYSISPSLTISPASGTLCAGSAITLTATGAQSYTWNGSVNSDTFMASPLSNTTYTVVGLSANGCSATASRSISVSTGPTLTITGNQTVCAGVSTTLTANGANTYSWTSGTTNSAAIVSPLTNTTYTVLGYNLAGCPGVGTVAVISNSVPVLLIQSSATSVCVNSPASFTVSGANSYSWSTSSNSSIITVTPAAAGAYTVSGTNSAGCISNTSITLGTYSLPIVSISSSSNGVCAGTSLTLSAGGANTYSWLANSNTPSIVVTPTGSTSYTVLGTETIHNCTNSAVASITIYPLPVLVLNGPGAGICEGNLANYTVSGASSYSWSTGSTATTMTVLPVTTNTYNVNGISNFGCANTLTFALIVYPLPTVVIVPTSPTVCANSLVSYTASGASGYLWNNSSSGAVYQVNPSSNTIYTVVGTSTQGCPGTQTVSVFVKPAPLLTVTPISNTLCAGSSGSFVVSGATTYTWNNSTQGNTFTYTAPSGGTTFTVSGTNTLGCNNSATVSVHTLSLPIIQITPSTSLACIGDQTNIQVSGAASYTWLPGGTTGSALSFTFSAPISYTVIGLSSDGCEQTAKITIGENICTSVTELGKNQAMGIYPNPSSGKVTVWKQETGKMELKVLSIDGKLIEQIEFDEELFELDLSRLTKGVYFISITHNKAAYTTKLVLD